MLILLSVSQWLASLSRCRKARLTSFRKRGWNTKHGLLRKPTALKKGEREWFDENCQTTRSVKFAISFLLMILPLLTGCGKYQRIQIPDVTKSATFTLTPPLGQSTSVDAFTLRIWGEIDGSADIWGTDLETNRYTNGKWEFEIRRSGPYQFHKLRY